jgi:hypothetical protein
VVVVSGAPSVLLVLRVEVVGAPPAPDVEVAVTLAAVGVAVVAEVALLGALALVAGGPAVLVLLVPLLVMLPVVSEPAEVLGSGSTSSLGSLPQPATSRAKRATCSNRIGRV